MTGMLTIAGLGPGDAALITPEVAAALADATDVVGYAPYVARVAAREGLVRHASDNRQELQRAAEAMRLAAEGRRVVVVSSGDPGVFAMASAVFEALESSPQWQGLVIRVLPGVTAMLAAAARAGAPLGIALYNPRSASRPEGFARALEVLNEAGCGDRITIFAHAVTTADERIDALPLRDARPDMADMRTLVIVGNSTTRRAGRWIYAPRRAS